MGMGKTPPADATVMIRPVKAVANVYQGVQQPMHIFTHSFNMPQKSRRLLLFRAQLQVRRLVSVKQTLETVCCISAGISSVTCKVTNASLPADIC